MAARRVYDVGRSPDRKDWQGKEREAQRAAVKAPTKAEAVRRTTEIAKKQPGDTQVIIRKETGAIQSERTYGHDPERRKG